MLLGEPQVFVFVKFKLIRNIRTVDLSQSVDLSLHDRHLIFIVDPQIVGFLLVTLQHVLNQNPVFDFLLQRQLHLLKPSVRHHAVLVRTHFKRICLVVYWEDKPVWRQLWSWLFQHDSARGVRRIRLGEN